MMRSSPRPAEPTMHRASSRLDRLFARAFSHLPRLARLRWLPWLALAWTGAACAWGQAGHSIVAELAQRRLTPAAAKAVAAALGPGVSLASVANWADDYRAVHKETGNWHFVDIPVGETTYDPQRDCAAGPDGDCIVAELARVQHDLVCDATPEGKATALRFAVHLVGDIHQPLHTVGDARGGNDVSVVLYARGVTCTGSCRPTPVVTNLHSVWDSGLVDKMAWNWGAIVDEIDASRATARDPRAAGTPLDWALETHAVGTTIWQQTPPDHFLDDAYYARMRPVILQQLERAGLRLARFLNETYAKRNCSS